MPRGDHSGSVIIIPAVKNGRRVITPEKIYVRKRYKDPATGKLREKKRLVQSRTEAREKHPDLLDEIKSDKTKLVQPAPTGITFDHLLAYFRKHYAKPAKYRGDVKVEGYRSINTVNFNLKVLEENFRGRLLKSITYDQLRAFKELRLRTPIVFVNSQRERQAASVHRELQLLRRLFNVAVRKKWMPENPFHQGDTLIKTASEPARMRILTQVEEAQLLERCIGPREHLGPYIIFALETAMRENEQLETKCSDVDLDAGVIGVRRMGDNPKRGFDRLVPISDRLRPVLEKLIADAGGGKAPLFKFRELKRSFHTALRLAGIEGFRWHDLRHTAITWMVAATDNPATVMKISGHTQWRTFLRYVNINAELVRGVAAQMNARRAETANVITFPASKGQEEGHGKKPPVPVKPRSARKRQ